MEKENDRKSELDCLLQPNPDLQLNLDLISHVHLPRDNLSQQYQA